MNEKEKEAMEKWIRSNMGDAIPTRIYNAGVWCYEAGFEAGKKAGEREAFEECNAVADRMYAYYGRTYAHRGKDNERD